MSFQFDSLSALWQMAGHGPYVWACYAVTWIALLYLLLAPIRKRKQLLQQIHRQVRLEQAEASKQVDKQSN